MSRYAQRLSDFVERERNFTRDASHEFRSPLTVIRMAAGMLQSDPGLSEANLRAAPRIGRAARDMEELTNAFLLLARESEAGLPVDEVCINDVAAEELDRARLLAEGRPVTSVLNASCRLHIEAPAKWSWRSHRTAC